MKLYALVFDADERGLFVGYVGRRGDARRLFEGWRSIRGTQAKIVCDLFFHHKSVQWFVGFQSIGTRTDILN